MREGGERKLKQNNGSERDGERDEESRIVTMRGERKGEERRV
jgi:hypothetical protein